MDTWILKKPSELIVLVANIASWKSTHHWDHAGQMWLRSQRCGHGFRGSGHRGIDGGVYLGFDGLLWSAQRYLGFVWFDEGDWDTWIGETKLKQRL